MDDLVACLKGFEPLTFWFVAKHSIRLSYRHMQLFFNAHILYVFAGKKSSVFGVKKK